jgi:hypothetical protein
MQVEALARKRRKGQQNITVKHVHVYAGGQAVVGAVSHRGGRGYRKNEQRAYERGRQKPNPRNFRKPGSAERGPKAGSHVGHQQRERGAVDCTARERGDCRFDLAGVAHDNWGQFHCERRCHALYCGQLADPNRCEGITKNCHPRHVGRNLFEQFEPLDAQAVFKRGKSGGVAARPCQACNQTRADRIKQSREYDRHGACRLL